MCGVAGAVSSMSRQWGATSVSPGGRTRRGSGREPVRSSSRQGAWGAPRVDAGNGVPGSFQSARSTSSAPQPDPVASVSPGSVSAYGFQAAYAASTRARGSTDSSRSPARRTACVHAPSGGVSSGPYASSQESSLSASSRTCSSWVRVRPAWISQ